MTAVAYGFHEERRSGIGGSDVAAIMGLSPWQSPQDIFEQKLGLAAPTEETPAMRWGTILEDPIAEEYARQTGYKIRRANKVRRHPDYHYMIAHLDRDVTRSDRIVECKSVGKWADMSEWGEPGTDQIPQYYLTQAHHYLVVTGKRFCDVAVLIAGQDFRIYTVEADPEIAQELIEAEAEFWDCVVRMEAPDAQQLDHVRARYRHSFSGEVIEVTRESRELLARYAALKKVLKSGEEEADSLLAEILNAMGHAEAIVETRQDRNGKERMVKLFTAKTQAPMRFDTKAHREQYPEVHAHFMKPSPSRPARLTTEGAKLQPQAEETEA